MGNRLIYGLVDPKNNQIKYIGKTTMSLEKRLYYHIQESKKTKKPNKKQSWILNLIKNNTTPEIILIESCNSDFELNESEIFFISYFKFLGQSLKNMQPGGEGNPKGYKFKNQFRNPKGTKIPAFEEYRKNGGSKGIIKSKETREKLSKAFKNKKRPELNKIVNLFNIYSKQLIIKENTEAAANFLNTTKSIITHYLCNNKKFIFNNTWVIFRNEMPKLKLKPKIIAENENICYIFNSKVEASKFFNVKKDIIYYYLNKQLMGYNLWVKQ